MKIKKALSFCAAAALIVTSALSVGAAPAESVQKPSVNSLVFDADHWTAESRDYTSTDTTITMGNSDYTDAHFSALYDTGGIALNEGDGENYVGITTRSGWDQAFSLRYGPHGMEDIAVNTENSAFLYMTVMFDEDNLAKFKSSQVFSKATIDGNPSYDGRYAFIVSLGSGCGVTFNAWRDALDTVKANEWTTLKLAITGTPSAVNKYFFFYFGANFSAVMNLKRIRIGTDNGLFGTYGAHLSVAPNAGLKFVSSVDTYDLLSPSDKIIGCGTLVTYYNAYLNGNGSFEKNGSFTYGGADYPIYDIPAEETVRDGSRLTFTAAVENIPTSDYNTYFAVRAYVEYESGGETVIKYTDISARSVYGTAKAAVEKATESEELLAKYGGIVEKYAQNEENDGGIDVILKLGNDYVLNGNQWSAQLEAPCEEVKPASNMHYLEFSMVCSDIENVISQFKFGSPVAESGADFTYGQDALGIYFSGSNVNNTGVLQNKLYNAITENRDTLKEGKKVRISLPISGVFGETSTVNAVNIILSCSEKAPGLSGIKMSISNVKLTETVETSLLNGAENALNNDNWDKQLSSALSPACAVFADTNKMSLDFACEDIERLITYRNSGSKGYVGRTGGNDMSYDESVALAIYFDGANVGVSKKDFYDAITDEENLTKLKDGKTVRLDLPISGAFENSSELTVFNFMPSHGDKVSGLYGLKVTFANIEFTAE